MDGYIRRWDDPDVNDTGSGQAPLVDMGAYEYGSIGGTDCNDNNQDDDCEIAEGAAADCNLNGRPDECEIAEGVTADCNLNGSPDECDAIGASDFDADGDVDLDDFVSFATCMAGPDQTPVSSSPQCSSICQQAFDILGDGAVDLRDYAPFQASFTGDFSP